MTGTQIVDLTSAEIINYTLLGALAIGIVGVLLLFTSLRDLGVGLLSGATVGLAVFALQSVNENVAQRAQEQQEKAARKETVALAIATTSDLSGFDPRGTSLKRAYLVAKTLSGAQFNQANLSHAELRDTQMDGALLRDANLRGANLINADLTGADLWEADLSGALLQDASFLRAEMAEIESLDGAMVNANTCWPPGFFTNPDTKRLVENLKPVAIDRPDQQVDASPGHICSEADAAP